MGKNQTLFNEIKTNLLAGLTTSLAILPPSISFAIILGVDPVVGLYTSFILGIISAIIGGKPGMVSGITSAISIFSASIVQEHGLNILFATVMLSGVFQIIVGILHFDRLIKMVQLPVMTGFINGLAILILLSQIQQFKVLDINNNLVWMQGTELYIMAMLTILTTAIVITVPKFTKAFPAELASIIIITLLVKYLNIDTKTVNDLASISGSLPSFRAPNINLNLETIKIISYNAALIALVGIIQALLALKIMDEKTHTSGSSRQECISQGIGNVVSSLFGGTAGCVMIGQSIINISLGGDNRWASAFSAMFIISFVLFGSKLIGIIPIASLVGIMIIVVINTFNWSSFRLIKKIPISDTFIMLTVTLVTITYDLAIAVIAGVVISSVIFSWKYSESISYTSTECTEKGEKTYMIKGPIFFNSVKEFFTFFDISNDPKEVILDLKKARIFDGSAVDTIKKLQKSYETFGKKLQIINLTENCRNLFKRAE